MNGIQASAYLDGKNLVLSGTVAGPIITKPSSPAEQSVYTFGIDRGGASKQGPFPGREHIRFDAVVVVSFLQTGETAYVQLTGPQSNIPQATSKPLARSAVKVDGPVITLKVPLSLLPSSGHAIDQWNVNFFSRNPDQRPNFQSVASFTPEFTDFQVYVKPPVTP